MDGVKAFWGTQNLPVRVPPSLEGLVQQLRSALGAPQGHRPVAILPIGHPAEAPRPRARRALDDLVHRV